MIPPVISVLLFLLNLINSGIGDVPEMKNLSSEFDKKYYSFGLGYTVDKRTTLEFSFTQGDWTRETEYSYSDGNITT